MPNDNKDVKLALIKIGENSLVCIESKLLEGSTHLRLASTHKMTMLEN